jgi:GT2 family glycosyltransferase
LISAVVLTWNSAQYIAKCLRSLAADAREAGMEMEIFVIDGGSTDGTLEILSQLVTEISSLRIIPLGKNLGTTASRNIAIQESQGQYILILDSDTEILPGALEALSKALESAPRIGIAAPRLFYPDGMVQPSCKRFPTASLKVCKFIPLPWLQQLGQKAELYPHRVYDNNFQEILRVDHCISACWLVRREAIKEVGLFDEKIFYAPEDVDYCLRMWLAGWEVLYVPSAKVVHHTQRWSHKSFKIAWTHAMGLLYYFRKYKYWLSRRSLYYRISKVAERHGIQPPFGIELINKGV